MFRTLSFRTLSFRALALVSLLATAMLLSACGSSSSSSSGSGQPPSEPGLPDTGLLILSSEDDGDTPTFMLTAINSNDPDDAEGSRNITGLEDGDTLVGIDYRPANGDLYAVGLSGTLYVIDPENAEVVSSVTLIPAPDMNPVFSGLEGTHFGVDFNPVPDRLRVTSNTGQNLRINVDTGETIVDGALSSDTESTRITGSAYTNSFAGTTSTRLFNIDSGDNLLYLQQPPNDGTLVNPVSLGVNVEGSNGFVIDGRNNAAFAALIVNGETGLYHIDLNAEADAATLIGELDVEGTVLGIALAPPAAPEVLALTRDNALLRFAVATPGSTTLTAISNLEMDEEQLIGIDVRPATGDLYAVSNQGNIYTLDPDSGEASLQASLVPNGDDAFSILIGLDFAMDFNPVPDRLRLMSDLGQNLRINVETGETITDGDIAYAVEDDLSGIEDIPLLGPLLALIGDIMLPSGEDASPTLTAAAYTNSFAGTESTQLFTLDVDNQTLNLQNPPNDGTQVPLVDLPVAATGDQGFDIAGGDNGLVLAALSDTLDGPYTLYHVNLATGAFTPVSDSATIGGGSGPAIRGITVLLH